MEIETLEIEPGVLRMVLSGKMDLSGARDVERAFVGLGAARQDRVIVDLADVTMLASIGIRALVTGAKAQKLHGGAMVLFRPVGVVEEVLNSTGIDEIIPIAHDMDAARVALGIA